MLKDITMGQYYSVKSPIHDIDPRVKLRFVLLTIILLLFDRNMPLYLLFTAVYIGILVISNIPIYYTLKGSGTIIAFLFICSFLNMFSTPGDKIKILFFTVSVEGIIKSAFVFWRIMLILFISSMLMYTTTPSRITDGIEKAFHMSGKVSMTITIALRYIGILFNELDRLNKAIQSRGGDISRKGLRNKFKMLKLMTVPLFQNSINRASNLGEAMDARCYVGGKTRTKYYKLEYKGIDYVAYLLILVLMIVSCYFIIVF